MLPNPVPKILTPNRIAAITTWLTGLAAFLTAIEGTFPKSWQNAALAIAGVLTSLVTALHFMWGSQKDDKNRAEIRKQELATQMRQQLPAPTSTDAPWWKNYPGVDSPEVLTGGMSEEARQAMQEQAQGGAQS